MSAATYVLAGGGTGGHLFPGIAVADELVRLDPGARLTFLTSDRELDQQLLGPTPYEHVKQTVRPFSLHPLRFGGFCLAWRRNVRAAMNSFAKSRPRAVLGLGGYAAGPAIVAARKLGIRCAILNPDAVPGLANRFLARRADLVVLQWDVSREHFAHSTHCRTLGCPIRSGFSDTNAAVGRERFGLQSGRPVLLVTGASQGARTINQALWRVWPEFSRAHPDWQLLHLTGEKDEFATREAYEAVAGCVRVISFTHKMPLALAAADVVVARAGASTLAELAALGKPSILLPYPYHRDRHQHANAQVLVDAGGALCIEDQRDATRNAGPLLEALEALTDDAKRSRMAAAAEALARPDAALRVAQWLVGDG